MYMYCYTTYIHTQIPLLKGMAFGGKKLPKTVTNKLKEKSCQKQWLTQGKNLPKMVTNSGEVATNTGQKGPKHGD